MFMNILVALMAIVAVVAGVWGWWAENHGEKNSNSSEDDKTSNK